MSLYRWAVVVGLLVQLIALAVILVNPSLGRLYSLSSAGGVPFSTGGSGFSGSILLLAALDGVLGLAAFILSIVAFIRWREGVAEIRRTGVPSRSFQPVVLTGAAAEADSGYRSALWTILLILLVTIGGVVAIAVVLFGSFQPTFNPNGTFLPPTSTQINRAVSSVIDAAVVLAVALLAVQLLLAYFVTKSLQGFVESGGPRARSVDLHTLRLLVLLAVGLGATGLLNVVYLGLGEVAVAGPVLLLFACQRYLAAFDERLAGTPD